MIPAVRRRSVVAKRAGQEELVVEIRGGLSEEADVANLLQRVDGRIASDGVGEIERLRSDERAPDVRELSIVAIIERVAERERAGEVRVERV